MCCGNCEHCPLIEGTLRSITRGRKKRKRKPGAGSSQRVKGHTRTPRGPNRNKPAVRVDGYKRGKATRKKKRRR